MSSSTVVGLGVPDVDIPEVDIPELDIVRLTARVGAEVRNVRLTGDLPEPVINTINQLLLRHKVIFFRDQGHLDDVEQERFASRLGGLVPHPTVGPIKGTASMYELDSWRGGGRANQWHTDVTFVDAYPKISVLRGVVIPEFGGDTIWSNTAAAYESLPPALQRFAEELWAVHSNAFDYALVRRANDADKHYYEEVFGGTIYETEHPVVRVHPATGERTLLLGNFAQRLVGFSKSDGVKLFDLFQSHITSPKNTVRWRWQTNDVAIWDNQATQHIAVDDYGDQHRVVRRATVQGDVPFSVDGRRSTTRIKQSAKPAAEKAA